jgi:small conductance mechanosensitive channel
MRPGAAHRTQRAATISDALCSLVSIIVVVVTLFWVLATLGVNLAPLLAGAGLAGVIIAFGAQNLLRDVIAGIFMVFEDQFGVGDRIDTGLATGTVESVTLRVTRLRDDDGVVWHVPNGAVTRIANLSQAAVPSAQSTDSDSSMTASNAASAMQSDPTDTTTPQ